MQTIANVKGFFWLDHIEKCNKFLIEAYVFEKFIYDQPSLFISLFLFIFIQFEIKKPLEMIT